MLKLLNSYSKKLEVFRPLKGKTVTMYNCGPTVYDYLTIGNLRSFLFADTLRRYLEYSEYKVKQVMNITDVGHALGDADMGRDKIEEAAAKEKITPAEIASKFTKVFFEDIRTLNLLPAAVYPTASEHVPAMIKLISRLLKKRVAYQVEHDIYFDLSKFPRYGRLSGNTVTSLVAGHRVEVNSKKKNPYDFALWIYNPRHLMQWESPWGSGYPGWHIECSAMAQKYLGDTIDIHTGGEDNKFPHHEAEIAQSESATGKLFARYWLHAAHLRVNGEKMAKSAGNYLRLEDIVNKGYEPRVVRWALGASHYRDSQNFTFDALDAGVSAVTKLDALWARLEGKGQPIGDQKKKVSLKQIFARVKKDFDSAMDTDLNTPKALAALFTFVHELNSALDVGVSLMDRLAAKKILHTLTEDVLGIELRAVKKESVPAEVKKMGAEREAARKNKNFVRADELRKAIAERGFVVKDTASGPHFEKV